MLVLFILWCPACKSSRKDPGVQSLSLFVSGALSLKRWTEEKGEMVEIMNSIQKRSGLALSIFSLDVRCSLSKTFRGKVWPATPRRILVACRQTCRQHEIFNVELDHDNACSRYVMNTKGVNSYSLLGNIQRNILRMLTPVAHYVCAAAEAGAGSPRW